MSAAYLVKDIRIVSTQWPKQLGGEGEGEGLTEAGREGGEGGLFGKGEEVRAVYLERE